MLFRSKEKKITRTRQYLRDSAICLHPRSCRDFTIIRENIQSATIQYFSLSRMTTIQNPNHQKRFFILRTGFTMGYKTGQNFFIGGVAPRPLGGLSISAPTWDCWPKPSLYGLSLRKCSIKNHATLFESNWVVN